MNKYCCNVLITCLSFCLSSLYVNAQSIQFEEVLPKPPKSQQFAEFERSGGELDVADVNGDSYPDILMIGTTTQFTGAKEFPFIYLNDGYGNYSMDNTNVFDKLNGGGALFAELNGDDQTDIIVYGNIGGDRKTKIYLNDGSGVFTEKNNQPFNNNFGNVLTADFNGDTFIDIIIEGEFDENYDYNTKLYLNDGNASFSLKEGTPFRGLRKGDIFSSDIDGNGTEDILMIGMDNDFNYISHFYRNSGNGEFTEDVNPSLQYVYEFDLEFSDIDLDGDSDLVLAGRVEQTKGISKVYINDGDGNFTIFQNLVDVILGSVSFSDVNNDNYPDLLLTGMSFGENDIISRLFINDGSGKFYPHNANQFAGAMSYDSKFCDVDQDGDKDVIIPKSHWHEFPILYMNDGIGNFNEVDFTLLSRLFSGDIEIADVNNDSYQDILITGINKYGDGESKLYLNDKTGDFNLKQKLTLGNIGASCAAFGDVNKDGYQDLIVSGRLVDPKIWAIRMYINDGSGNLNWSGGTPFEAINNGDIKMADLNSDGNLDVLITGTNSSLNPTTSLYWGDGNAGFIKEPSDGFEDVDISDIGITDIDLDGDLDVLLMGLNTDNNSVTELYTNDGAGIFSPSEANDFIQTSKGGLVFGNLNNDLYPDLIISGSTSEGSSTQLYINNGDGVFAFESNSSFPPTTNNSISLLDINQDNSLDVLLTGGILEYIDGIAHYVGMSKIYINDGSANFIEAEVNNLDPLYSGITKVADIDNDGRDDVLMLGKTNNYRATTKVFRNISCYFPELYPNVSDLTDIKSKCSVTVLDPPLAYNNCDQQFIGTTVIDFPITESITITWEYSDGQGNTLEQTQNVIIDNTLEDLLSPIPNIEALEDVISECEISDLTIPTATDFCSGQIDGALNRSLPISEVGSTEVTWTYTDDNGNFFTQNQTIIIEDEKNPVPDLVELPDLYTDCSINALVAPTATDNCSGIITGTHSWNLPYFGLFEDIIVWTFEDGNGNISTQYQTVYFDDFMPPEPDEAFLPDILAECSLSELIPPMATDECSGSIVGVTDIELPIEMLGETVVYWEFMDENGMLTIQEQIISITLPPLPTYTNDFLEDIVGECSVDMPVPPTASFCTEIIEGVPDIEFPITTPGITEVTWHYEIDEGIMDYQVQNVILTHDVQPTPVTEILDDLIESCEISIPSSPSAMSNCGIEILGVPNIDFPITTQGETIVVWTYEDDYGNITEQTQIIIVRDEEEPTPFEISLPDLIHCTSITPEYPSASDNCAGEIIASANMSFPITESGIIVWTYNDGNGNVVEQSQNVYIDDELNAETNNISASICSGETYTFPDGTTSEVSIVQISILEGQATNGCNKEIVTILTTLEVEQEEIEVRICEGEEYIFPDGTSSDVSVVQTSTLAGAGVDGCDRVIVTALTVIEMEVVTTDANICDGESYTFADGTSSSLAQVYTSVLMRGNGCDSLITTSLTVNPVYNIEDEPITICVGESVMIYGVLQSNAGTYTLNSTSIHGCDSIRTTELITNNYEGNNISGVVLYNDIPITDGLVKLIRKDGNSPQSMYYLDSMYVNNDGTYAFNNLEPAKYLIKAKGEEDHYPDAVTTYASNTNHWQWATQYQISQMCNDGISADVELIDFPTEIGFGTIEGNIIIQNEGGRTEEYNEDVAVHLYSLQGEFMGSSEVDASSFFRIENIEIGEYSLVVDILGYTMENETVSITSASSEPFTYSVDLCVDDETFVIGRCEAITGVTERRFDDVEVYPNPTNSHISVCSKDSRFHVELSDLRGVVVYKNHEFISGQKIKMSLLEPGTYLLRINDTGGISQSKVVKY